MFTYSCPMFVSAFDFWRILQPSNIFDLIPYLNPQTIMDKVNVLLVVDQVSSSYDDFKNAVNSLLYSAYSGFQLDLIAANVRYANESIPNQLERPVFVANMLGMYGIVL